MFLHGLRSFVFFVWIKLVHLSYGLNHQLMNLLVLKLMCTEKAEGLSIVSCFTGQRLVRGRQRHLGLKCLWTTTLASVPLKKVSMWLICTVSIKGSERWRRKRVWRPRRAECARLSKGWIHAERDKGHLLCAMCQASLCHRRIWGIHKGQQLN